MIIEGLPYSYGGFHAIAHLEVSRAIRAGKLPAARECLCMDCGNPAQQYDHRDYNRPLQVDPVCSSCNLRRGPGIPPKLYAEFACENGLVAYILRKRTVQLFERVGLSTDILKSMPKKLDKSHWELIWPVLIEKLKDYFPQEGHPEHGSDHENSRCVGLG